MTRRHVPDQRSSTPLLRLDLSDGARAVGWIRDRTIGFRGFANEANASVAAWVAYGTAARRLARGNGTGPVPVDVEPLAFRRVDGRELILASGQRIGTLLLPEAGSRSGSDSFGFEIEIPAPADELRMRSMAHLIYRTLRRSGVEWSAPVPDVAQAKPSVTFARKHRADPTLTRGGIPMYNPNPDRNGMHTRIPVNASLPPPANLPSGTTFVARVLLISMAVVATIALIITAPLNVTVPLGFVLLAGLFGTLVLSALERRRQRRREIRDRGSSGVSRSSGTTSRDPDSANRTPAGSGALAAFSISLLGIAFLAPEQLGVVMAAIGLAGLFVLRLFAMFGGWAPRGSAWAEPRPAAPIQVAG